MVYDMSEGFERTGTFKRYTNLPRRYTWRSWNAMMRRCYDLKHNSSKNYGMRGIKVCDRWHVFDNFIEDMGMRPKDHIIGRKDHQEDYSLENCRWEHRSLSSRSKRDEVSITINGETRCLKDWARLSGISRETIRNRMRRGWTAEKLLLPGKYALVKEDARDLLAAILKDVDLEGEAAPICIDTATWVRIQRYMKVSQFLQLT